MYRKAMIGIFSIASRRINPAHRPTSLLVNLCKQSPSMLAISENWGQRYLSQRRPKSSTFKNKSSNGVKVDVGHQDDPNNLARLSFNAPPHLRRQALDMYAQCKLSERGPTTRFAIVRQMRNLDLPPHQELWQGINATDELALYRWVDGAFGQLIYQKGLWRPSRDWGPEDDEAEAIQRAENLNLLRTAYEEQIVNPLKERFGSSEVTIALSELRDDQTIYTEPAIIWQSVDRKTGEISLEWMSEYTADVAWPGLAFSKSVGGVARGLGKDGEMLPFDNETEGGSTAGNHSSLDPKPLEYQSPILAAAHANQMAAEAVLMKKLLQERNLSPKNAVRH
ncbi:hypothetical protein PSTT_01022 [Puccinia striiformis]|uniref:Uncharacterized protein n=1 Tax=Puccinia striiformis TaxID=27350 RepID=A0A2S4W5A3_9BASI|nr:hypothetical protein PSTT_01022 [Puccinia striiformis]